MEEEMLEMLNKNKSDKDKSDDGNEWVIPDAEIEEDTQDEPEIEVELNQDIMDELSAEQDDFFSAEKKAGRHPMAELAYKYSMTTFNWFRKHNKELQKHFTAHLAAGYGDEVMEASEVMQWYHMFIFTKLKRALSGYYEQEEFEEADFDMNGSAKVALIGLDRSIEAATVLIRHMKVHREELKEFRSQLEKIRAMAEETFPDAREFIRPGLDEM
jgi:predicted protein tyrosine phosphatase